MNELGKTGILARDKKIDYVLFDAPDGERYGKVIGWRRHDTLIVLTIPYYGGDERTFLVKSKNYDINAWGDFSCVATVTPVLYDGEVTLDGLSTEATVYFKLIKADYSTVYITMGIIGSYLLIKSLV